MAEESLEEEESSLHRVGEEEEKHDFLKQTKFELGFDIYT
jgi:hypothetical protein